MLLSPADGVYESVLDELRRLEPKRIVILGGTSTLGPAVEDALEAIH